MGLSLPPLPAAIRPLTAEESGRISKIHSRLSSVEACLTCGGAKRFLWWNEDRSDVVDWDCSCVDQWVLSRYLLASGIPLSYQRYGWADLAVPEESIALAKWWVDNSSEALNRGLSIMLSGPPGTGKTLLAAMLLKSVLAQGHMGFMATYSGLIDLLMNSWHDEEDRVWWMRRVRNSHFLVIDDLGRERKGQRMVGADEAERTGTSRGMKSYSLPMAESTLEEVIRHRVASALPTIITTNLTIDQVQQGYGSNSMSLLRESTLMVQMVAEDYRAQARDTLLNEMQRGLRRPVVLA